MWAESVSHSPAAIKDFHTFSEPLEPMQPMLEETFPPTLPHGGGVT